MSLCDKKVSVMKRLIQIVLISAIIIPSCGGGGNSGLKDVDPKVDSLLRIMTLDEKIGQMVLFTSDWDVTGPTIKDRIILSSCNSEDICSPFQRDTQP